MGDEDDGLAEPANEFAELALEFRAGDRIERAEGLVHQQNGWIGSEGPGDANTLALAAGKFVRAAGGEFVRIETDEDEEFFDSLGNAAGSHFSNLGTKPIFCATVKWGNKPAFLNNVSDAAAQANGIPLGGRAALHRAPRPIGAIKGH